jgi:cytidylate kinase
LAETANGFLVAAISDFFGLGSKLPPLAKGLRDAEAGQVVAGEKDERVFLDLALDTKDAASATQIQQVVQGLIAMAALSQPENPDLQKLVQGARVEGRDKRVTLRVDVALADVIEKVGPRRKQRRP